MFVTHSIEDVISQLEQQRTAIDKALEALRSVGGVSSSAVVHNGNRRSEAQKARWAAVRAGAPATKKRRGLTPEGRERLAENMRKRWAAKRTAAQEKKRKRSA